VEGPLTDLNDWLAAMVKSPLTARLEMQDRWSLFIGKDDPALARGYVWLEDRLEHMPGASRFEWFRVRLCIAYRNWRHQGVGWPWVDPLTRFNRIARNRAFYDYFRTLRGG
jgi:hypothetical protein